MVARTAPITQPCGCQALTSQDDQSRLSCFPVQFGCNRRTTL
jgi:hypothetical protein